MRVSTKGRYALRMMIEFGLNPDQCTKISQVAARQGISDKYLEQIVSLLHKAGYVRSIRGAQGGYQGASAFPEVRRLISRGKLEEAQELLDGVPPAARSAEWYFLNGTVQYRRGWFDNAFTSFANACRMDPSNAEYRQAMNNAQRQTGRRYNPYNTGNYNGGCSACDVCQGLICADCCCECMGGDLIPCC